MELGRPMVKGMSMKGNNTAFLSGKRGKLCTFSVVLTAYLLGKSNEATEFPRGAGSRLRRRIYRRATREFARSGYKISPSNGGGPRLPIANRGACRKRLSASPKPSLRYPLIQLPPDRT